MKRTLLLLLFMSLLLSACGKREINDQEKEEIVQNAFKDAFDDTFDSGTKKEKNTTYIGKGESVSISMKEGEHLFDLYINSHEWKDSIDLGFSGKIVAKNQLLILKITGENKSKKPSHFNTHINIKLLSSDGYEYQPKDVLQLTEYNIASVEGEGNCLSCDINPGDSASDIVIFDVSRSDNYNLLVDGLSIDERYEIDIF